MNILIIGGTGLISTPLTNLLLARGDTVTLYNRSLTTARVAPGAKVISGDRQRYSDFEKTMTQLGAFDCVIDMVAFHPDDVSSAVRAFAGRTGQYIFCSTVDVYRKPATQLPYTELETYGGLNEYSSNKVECERILWAAHARQSFPVTMIRPAYTYGPGRSLLYPVGWAGGYLERIRRGKPLIVPGDGNSLWVACHADDVARAFANAVGNRQTFGRAYHTTGEEWMTWNAYHQGVAKALGAPDPVLVHIPTDLLLQIAPKRAAIVAENFQFNNIFDNSAARTDLGFAPSIDWITGVKTVIEWEKQYPATAEEGERQIDDQILTTWETAVKDLATHRQG